jgi:hypothetical protein
MHKASARPNHRPTVRQAVSRPTVSRLGRALVLLSLVAPPLGCAGAKAPATGKGGSGGKTQASGGAGGSTAPDGRGGAATGGVVTGGTAGGGESGSSGAGGEGGSGGEGGDDGPGGAGGNPEDLDASDSVDSSVDGPGISCTDKVTNGDETDTDCGGDMCPKCWAGKICQKDSDCRSGGCSSGKCIDPFVPTATISTDGYLWKIAVGTTELAVQPNGGKINSFSLDGTNMLVINDAATGAICWIAPQSDWSETGWPPPSEMDENANYTASSKDNVLTMTGPAGTDGLSIKKRFWGNVEHQAVTIEYTIKNASKADVKKAAWEISRHYPGGLTFFPTVEAPVPVPGPNIYAAFQPLPFTTSAGVAWFKYQKADWTQDSKGGTNGSEGWAAHINCGKGLEKTCASGAKSMVLIKDWADSTTEAPGEKEIEIFANAGHNFIEFEQQSDYQTIPAGGTLVWTMHWMLRYLPSDMAPTPGNADLVGWVRGQLL